jgi:hypothetical protein
MADFPTRTDLFRIGRDRILRLNGKLSAEVVQRDGTDANVMLAGGSAMADAVVGQLVNVCRGQFLDSAEKTQLDRLVFDRFGLVRKPAAPSLGTAQFTTTNPVAAAFTLPNNLSLSTPDGIAFITTVASSFPIGSTGPIFVPIRSSIAGFNQQAKAGSITSIKGNVPGGPGDLVVTNLVATAGAADVEDDPSLRDRARRFWTTSQRGTLAAIENGAVAVPGVVRAATVEVLDSSGRPGRWVQLLISDRFTDALVSINQTSAAYDAQSQTLARTVFNALAEFRCGGNYVQVIVAQVALLMIRLDLTFSASIDPIAVSEQARAVVVNHVNSLDPGAPFVPEDAVTVLRSVSGLLMTGNEIAVPAGTVQPRAMQVIRTSFDLVTATNQGAALFTTTNPDQLVRGVQ